ECAVFLCSSDSCEGTQVKVQKPGSMEAEMLPKLVSCPSCGCPLGEDPTARILADKATLRFLRSRASRSGCTLIRIFPLSGGVSHDDVAKEVELGTRYTLVVYPFQDSRTRQVYLEVNNILQRGPHDPVLSPAFGEKAMRNLPLKMLRLYRDRMASPFSFPLSLAWVFGETLAPQGTFHRLRLVLLLALVSTRIHERSLSILCCGGEAGTIGKLMRWAMRLSPHSMAHVHTSLIPLTGLAVRDSWNPEEFSLEAGSLLLASCGVCFLGDLLGYKKEQLTLLRQCMEKGSVTIGIPWKAAGVYEQPLRAGLWAQCTSSTKGSRKPSFEILKVPFQEAFDLIINVEEADESQHLLISHLLDDSHIEAYLGFNNFMQLLEVAGGLRPMVNKAGEFLIQGYYVASRRMRSGSGVPNLPQSAIHTITRMAESLAALSLREEAREEDACLAILLYEETIASYTQWSPLCVTPVSHLIGQDLDILLGKLNDDKMQSFLKDLETFLRDNAGYTLISQASAVEEE
ncbi:unnamed protein product, partial [Darwinula stevensoni]